MDKELYNKVSKEAYEHIDRIITNKANNEILDLTNRTLDITNDLTSRILKIETQVNSFSTMKDIEAVKNWVWNRFFYGTITILIVLISSFVRLLFLS